MANSTPVLDVEVALWEPVRNKKVRVLLGFRLCGFPWWGPRVAVAVAEGDDMCCWELFVIR